MQTPADSQLHELARKRVDFKAHLIVYCVTNAALWIIWFVTGRGYVWPVWPMAGWALVWFFIICSIIVFPDFFRRRRNTKN